MLISGDRGTGKTAIIYDFLRKSKSKKTLSANIVDYGDLELVYDEADFYDFVIRQFCDALFKALSDDAARAKRLSKQDRVLLTYYLARFTKNATRNVLLQKISDIQVGLIHKIGAVLYKFTRIPLNVGANAAVNILGDMVSRAMGAPSSPQRWSEYFPELNINIDNDFADADSSYASFRELLVCPSVWGMTSL